MDLVKFLDENENTFFLHHIKKGGYASVDCYFNNKINKYYALK